MENNFSADELRELQLNQATRWLLEMEMVDSPQLKNFLILNIFKSSNRIKDVSLLIDTNLKAMLIYLKLDFWGRVFKKSTQVSSHILDQLQSVLPSFTCRVVYDRKIFELALQRAEEMAGVSGGINETPLPKPASVADDSIAATNDGEAGDSLQSTSDTVPDTEEQTDT